MTLHLKYIDSQTNELFYESIDWWWFTAGLETVIKPGVVSISENYRNFANESKCCLISMERMYEEAAKGFIPQTFYMRIVLKEKKKKLSRYFKLAYSYSRNCSTIFNCCWYKKYEGCVISRNNFSHDNLPLYCLNETNWFQAVANTDLWLPLENDPRRFVPTKLLSDLGQDIGSKPITVWSIMNTFPVRNPSTIYSVIMIPATGIIEGFVQNGFV